MTSTALARAHRSIIRTLLICLFTISATATAHGATIVLNAGQLAGFDGIEVNGDFYDVRFVGGQFNNYQAYQSTNGNATFFTPGAGTAAAALLAAVQATSFDTNPAGINGCSASNYCGMATPFGVVGSYFGTVIAYNYAGAGDTTGALNISPGHNVSSDSHLIWAAWSTSAVPEPGTGLLVMLGLTGLAGTRKRRASAKTPPSHTA